jgi:hypothetical protein
MAKDKSTAATRESIEAQRRKAQAAIDKNRVVTSRGKHRSLAPRERAAYQRVVTRADKLLGPVPKPRGEAGGELMRGLRTLKAFAERIRGSAEEAKKIPGKMP